MIDLLKLPPDRSCEGKCCSCFQHYHRHDDDLDGGNLDDDDVDDHLENSQKIIALPYYCHLDYFDYQLFCFFDCFVFVVPALELMIKIGITIIVKVIIIIIVLNDG